MTEDDGAGGGRQERADGNVWMRDDRGQQINNQALMGVAKAGRDTAVKAKAAPVVHGAFRCRVDYGSGRKVGANVRAAVDNRQQWQQQSGNNQLKVTVASGGIDSRGGGGKQRWSTVIGSKTPTAKVIVDVPLTPLLLLSASGGRWVVAATSR
jgi:hypothetical protein